jgi:hypothetical protein
MARLGAEQLYQRRALVLTTDSRHVPGELVSRHLGKPTLASVFPGYDAIPSSGLRQVIIR